MPRWLRGFWNDKDGIGITDAISVFTVTAFAVLTGCLINAVLRYPYPESTLTFIFNVYDKVVAIMLVILGGYYGTGAIKNLKLGPVNKILPQKQVNNTPEEESGDK